MEGLPRDLLVSFVLPHLDGKSMCNVAACCRRLHQVVQSESCYMMMAALRWSDPEKYLVVPPAVCIDLGSHSVRAGFAGDDAPVFECTRCQTTPEQALKRCFQELAVNPRYHGCLVALHEASLVRPLCLFASTRLMCRFFLALPDAAAALYSAGRTTGLAVMFGERSTRVTAFCDGLEVARGSLENRGASLVAQELLELRPELMTLERAEQAARLGTLEYWEDTEEWRALHRVYFAQDALPRCIARCVQGQQCARDLYCNVILAGGMSLAQGLSDCISKELHKVQASRHSMVLVVAPPERLYSVWIGASICASLPQFLDSFRDHDGYTLLQPGKWYQ